MGIIGDLYAADQRLRRRLAPVAFIGVGAALLIAALFVTPGAGAERATASVLHAAVLPDGSTNLDVSLPDGSSASLILPPAQSGETITTGVVANTVELARPTANHPWETKREFERSAKSMRWILPVMGSTILAAGLYLRWRLRRG